MFKSSALSLAASVVVVALLVPVAAGPVQASRARSGVVSRAVGYDPRDLPTHRALDVRQSEKAVVSRANGSYLRIKVWSHAPISNARGENVGIAARLDSHGGPRWDYTLELFLGDSGSDWAPACLLYRPSGELVRSGARPVFWDSGAMSCSVRLASLNVSHSPRWRVVSYNGFLDVGLWADRYDLAPDAGWYS
ncbi:MAG: hypothetical protein WAN48_08235 [Actinomycetes bacterium]